MNCAANASRVTAVRAAIGDRDGEADLYFGDGSDTASLGRAEGRRFERVPIRTLASYLEQQGVGRVFDPCRDRALPRGHRRLLFSRFCQK